MESKYVRVTVVLDFALCLTHMLLDAGVHIVMRAKTALELDAPTCVFDSCERNMAYLSRQKGFRRNLISEWLIIISYVAEHETLIGNHHLSEPW
jgi:hypothetical protein